MANCTHTEGRIYEPLDCESVDLKSRTQKNPERARRLRATYGESYHKATGAYTVPGHDCAYVDRRNALIPEAERIARAETRAAFPNDAERDGIAAGHFESRAFLNAMTRLWSTRGSRG